MVGADMVENVDINIGKETSLSSLITLIFNMSAFIGLPKTIVGEEISANLSIQVMIMKTPIPGCTVFLKNFSTSSVFIAEAA